MKEMIMLLTADEVELVSGGKFPSDPSAQERMILREQGAATGGYDPIHEVIEFFTPQALNCPNGCPDR